MGRSVKSAICDVTGRFTQSNSGDIVLALLLGGGDTFGDATPLGLLPTGGVPGYNDGGRRALDSGLAPRAS
jgi:hypothetical protein